MIKAFTIIDKDLIRHSSFSINEEDALTEDILDRIQEDAIKALENEGIDRNNMIVVYWDKKSLTPLKDFKLSNEIHNRQETSRDNRVEASQVPERDTEI